MSSNKQRARIAQHTDKLELIRQIEDLQAELNSVSLAVAVHQRDANAARRIVEQQRSTINQLAHNNDFLRGENSRLEARLIQQAKEIADMVQRFTWIITHPIRWIVSAPTLLEPARTVVTSLPPVPASVLQGDIS